MVQIKKMRGDAMDDIWSAGVAAHARPVTRNLRTVVPGCIGVDSDSATREYES
jgi:hypothetical protein